MAEFICKAYNNLELWRVNIDQLREQDINAQCMSPEMQERLTLNIAKEQRLESVPFVVRREDGKFDIISGHHRYRAARNAGLKEIIVLVETRPLDRSRVVSKQVAHNRLVGTSDPQVLKRLCEEMVRPEDLLEAFIDKDDLKINYQPVPIDDIIIKYDWKILVLSFLPAQLNDIKSLCDAIPPETTMIGACDIKIYDEFRQTLLALGKAEDIRNLGTVVAKMVEITKEYLAAQAATEEI
jgi:hypothetical protein